VADPDAYLADRLEIDDLLTRYAVALDTKQWDLLDTVFTPDATVDYRSAGGAHGSYPEVRAWLEQTLAGFPMTQHLVANRDVRIDGDTATARSYFYNPMGLPRKDGSLKLFFVGGYYNDRLRRTPDGWRIVERIEETAWMDGLPTPDAG
jgi:3-phenylpropionate/cinnamic acid dioxygenase small subunit